MEPPYPDLRSEHSQTQVYVRFVNLTNRNVDIIWVDFTGNFIKYKTFSRYQFLDINTFTGHPWIFWDKNKDNMCVDGKDIFYPTPTICPTTKKLARKCVGVHLPLYSLKTRALLAVRDYLKDGANLQGLDLPRVLLQDLKVLLEDRIHRHIYLQ